MVGWVLVVSLSCGWLDIGGIYIVWLVGYWLYLYLVVGWVLVVSLSCGWLGIGGISILWLVGYWLYLYLVASWVSKPSS